MLIPIRCVTCNTVLAGKWIPYCERVKEQKRKDGRPADDQMVYLQQTTTKTAEGRVLDELGLTKVCCRRHMLTHVDLV
jgi:DNA-directed RNA polymerase subunit N (RpoN/RPB10)